jgi:hypothetical protein
MRIIDLLLVELVGIIGLFGAGLLLLLSNPLRESLGLFNILSRSTNLLLG